MIFLQRFDGSLAYCLNSAFPHNQVRYSILNIELQQKRANIATLVTIILILAVTPSFFISARAQSGTSFTTIDLPGAVLTGPADINNIGEIAGRYRDTGGIVHGFLLSSGTFTSITFPNAVFTRALGINGKGEIVGDYSLTSETGSRTHGYLLRSGTFTPFDFPGADATIALGINTVNSDIVGSYVDKVGTHGFLLSGARFTSINFPGADFTKAWRINDFGVIMGLYHSSADDKFHIYRLIGGSFTPVGDFPGSLQTAPSGDMNAPGDDGGFNNLGDIASTYCSSGPCNFNFDKSLHGFLLSGGVYTSFDPPGSVWTAAFGMNDNRDIVGAWRDASGKVHGYLRTL